MRPTSLAGKHEAVAQVRRLLAQASTAGQLGRQAAAKELLVSALAESFTLMLAGRFLQGSVPPRHELLPWQ